MTLTVSPTDSDILAVLRGYLVSILDPSVEVVRGQDNLVSEPMSADFIVMTSLRRQRLATNVTTWQNIFAPVTRQIEQSVQVSIQLDIHGPNGTDNANMVATMLRDSSACDYFAASGKALMPLYADDGRQMPFINGEGAYEDRWVVTAELQAALVVSTPEQFAANLKLSLVSVDVVYPG